MRCWGWGSLKPLKLCKTLHTWQGPQAYQMPKGIHDTKQTLIQVLERGSASCSRALCGGGPSSSGFLLCLWFCRQPVPGANWGQAPLCSPGHSAMPPSTALFKSAELTAESRSASAPSRGARFPDDVWAKPSESLGLQEGA